MIDSGMDPSAAASMIADLQTQLRNSEARVQDLEAATGEQDATIAAMDLACTQATEEVDRLEDRLSSQTEQITALTGTLEAAIRLSISLTQLMRQQSAKIQRLNGERREWRAKATSRLERIKTLKTQRDLLGGLTVVALTGKATSLSRMLSA